MLYFSPAGQAHPRVGGLGRLRQLPLQAPQVRQQLHEQGLPEEEDIQEVCGGEAQGQRHQEGGHFAAGEDTYCLLKIS